MAYEIEGRLLEVCTCNVLCPCWVGEDPDDKTCDTAIAWGIETGIDRGRRRRRPDARRSRPTSRATSSTPKSWKAVVFVDDGASDEQQARCSRCSPGSSAARSPTWPASSARSSRSSGRRSPSPSRVARAASRSATIVDAEMTPFIGATGKPTIARPRRCSARSRARPSTRQVRASTRATAAPHGLPSVDLHGPQRPPGPLPLRRLTRRGPDRCSRVRTSATPRRDRAILVAVARRRSPRPPGSRSWLWDALARTAATSTTTRGAGLGTPLEVGAVRRRLGR